MSKQSDNSNFHDHSSQTNPVPTVFSIAKLVQDFRKIKRIPMFSDGERENDVEHSYILSLVALELANIFNYDLDLGKIMGFALVHDLLELETGDINTFNSTDDELNMKRKNEAEALQKLLPRLPKLTAKLLEEYESQESSEATFVKLVDKILPAVIHIIGSPKQVFADLNIKNLAELKTITDLSKKRSKAISQSSFPEILELHNAILEILETEFQENAKNFIS